MFPSRGGLALASILRTETVGGVLLIAAAALALIWANTPWGDTYEAVRTWVPWPGGEALGLDLDIAHWTADGLLAVFFFVVGLELKREFVTGDLRDPARAAVPVIAAICGMLVPALFYVAVNVTAGPEALRGWAIPTATDIAFALAVLAVVSSHLPASLRGFLLTLAVVDDLLAITIIALFYTDDFHPGLLGVAVVPILLFGLLVQRGRTWWWALLPLALLAWYFVHESGVHATIAGVLLGFTVPVLARGDRPGLAEHFEHLWRPLSAGLAVPLFALFAAGVSLSGPALREAMTSTVALGVVCGLLLGKVIGILGSSWIVSRFTRASLDPGLSWWDVLGVSLLAGIGFTVSLLIGELAFDTGDPRVDHVKTAVLVASVLAATVASVVLGLRNRAYRRHPVESTGS
ncbi:Na+/H+ antiporter NhaA [Saccharopolyspora montiporae]|uniref:Na+/H+ antiporter NhaA n=1 Tax=Saccharopolyspora montiporae TaxID=2781240 RepID=UPI00351C6431